MSNNLHPDFWPLQNDKQWNLFLQINRVVFLTITCNVDFLNIDIDVIRYQNIRSIKSILLTSTCYTYEVNRKFINIWYENKRLSFFYFLFLLSNTEKLLLMCMLYASRGRKIGFKFIQFSLNLLNKTGFLIVFLLKQILT